MKKFLYPIVLGALLVSCAEKDAYTDGQEKGEFNEAKASGYLSVKLAAPGGLYGRANGDYQYGTYLENYVNEVRFYFFNDEGKAVEIRKNPIYDPENSANGPEYFSYYDWDPTPAENDYNQPDPDTETDPDNSGSLAGNGGDSTVEKILSTMIVLNLKEETPTQIVAIVNPSAYVKSLTKSNPMPDLDVLTEAVSDNLTGLTDKNFLMANSIYIDANDEIVITQPIAEDNFGATIPQAKENPITVYVERTVARLDMNMDITYDTPEGGTAPQIIELPSGVKLYPTQKTITTEDRIYEGEAAPEGQLDDEDIYVKFLGWAVTSTPTSSYVIKNINAAWGSYDELFGVENQPWYIFQYHRSFWATNSPLLTNNPSDNSYIWYSYNQLSGQNYGTPTGSSAIKKLGFDMTDTQTYMQENANPAPGNKPLSPAYPTKVIFAAQLCDNEGNAVELTEWNGVYFTFTGLKNLAAKMLDMYYIKPGTGTAQVPAEYLPISGEQITFITASQYAGTNPLFSDTPNYTVYATLTSKEGSSSATDNAKGLQWYHLNDNIHPEEATPQDYTAINMSTINNYIQAVFGHAKVWRNGFTYYYYTIRHLGAPEFPGYYGVVRNHVYKGTVDGLKGLGTPVWDPNEPIYPEHPTPDGNNLSAQIEVLAWRLVTDSYEFEW